MNFGMYCSSVDQSAIDLSECRYVCRYSWLFGSSAVLVAAIVRFHRYCGGVDVRKQTKQNKARGRSGTDTYIQTTMTMHRQSVEVAIVSGGDGECACGSVPTARARRSVLSCASSRSDRCTCYESPESTIGILHLLWLNE